MIAQNRFINIITQSCINWLYIPLSHALFAGFDYQVSTDVLIWYHPALISRQSKSGHILDLNNVRFRGVSALWRLFYRRICLFVTFLSTGIHFSQCPNCEMTIFGVVRITGFYHAGKIHFKWKKVQLELHSPYSRQLI